MHVCVCVCVNGVMPRTVSNQCVKEQMTKVVRENAVRLGRLKPRWPGIGDWPMNGDRAGAASKHSTVSNTCVPTHTMGKGVPDVREGRAAPHHTTAGGQES